MGKKLYTQMNVDGCIIFPKGLDEDKAWEVFIKSLEDAGLSFGGTTDFEDCDHKIEGEYIYSE